MSSKILSFAENINKPFVKFIIKNGWDLRIIKKN